MVDLTGDAPRVVEHVETGRVYLDGTVLIGALDGVVRERIAHGAARPRRGQRHHRRGRPAARRRLGRGHGLPDNPQDARRRSRARSRPSSTACCARAKPAELDDDDALEELIQRTCSRVCNDAVGKKPVVTVMISRLEA